MGSFKRDGRNQGSDRRRGEKAPVSRLELRVESLEGRTLLDASPWQPTTTNLADVKHGPMANAGQDLINLYQSYLHNGGNAGALAQQYTQLDIQGSTVNVAIIGIGNLSTFTTTLKNIGMKVANTSATYNLVSGYVPISELPQISAIPQTLTLSPNYKPVAFYVGKANNEAEASQNANTARSTYGVDGTGVTVGVLSTTVNKVGNGLADSVATGDLPNNVQVLDDSSTVATDEGRAMLENIHDIAPGAGLAFATGFNSQISMANNILALANTAKANVIVDDIGYLSDPFFQDGYIAQSIDNVVGKGVTYLSAAGNSGEGSGYLSNFRATSATVGSIGSGTYMNFAPSGTAVTQLPITTKNANEIIGFQYDQPFFTQQPTGSTNDVTSDLDFYILDSSGNIVTSSTSNNLATHEPFEAVQIPTAGSYTVVIKLVSGPNPGHVEFVGFSQGQTGDFVVSKQFGTAGGTYYPASSGHNAAAANIGVGAVPWWASSPYLNTSPLNSESFSSSGPSITVRNIDGSLINGGGTLNLNPYVSGADGGNTSFFGEVIDTSNPPFPGEPATTGNLSQNLPSFFGTSSASPNVAAVAALLKQKNPALTPAQIKTALAAGARPLNSASPGIWNSQGGYGLVDAVSALASIDVLRVSSVTPTNASTVSSVPTKITVAFNKPVKLSTLSAANLVFTGLPAGVASVTVGTPVGVDSLTTPTQVVFPITVNLKTNGSANGTFTYSIQGNVQSADGKPLQAATESFILNDTILPTVVNTNISGRILKVTFSEAMAASTITARTIFLNYLNPSTGTWVDLNNDPRFTIAYDPSTLTATLDYSGLNQTQLPSGRYTLVVRAANQIFDANGKPVVDSNGNPTYEEGVTDAAGNRLDGKFSGVFPSGDGNPGGRAEDENFIQDYGTLTLGAPFVTTLTLTAATDTGIAADNNTSLNQPSFIGQVASSFPGTVAGLTVLIEFNGYHGGNFTLSPQGGRGYTGNYDITATTDVNGTFRFTPPVALPQGYQKVRVVVIGQADSPPLPGFSSQSEAAFRIDNTAPQIVAATLTPGGAALALGKTATTNLNSLTSLSLNVVDPIQQGFSAFATPTAILFPALDPTIAGNISNYQLLNLDDPTDEDKSRFIASATFVPTASNFALNSVPSRSSTSDPYSGRIDLTFSPGLNKGHYVLIAHTKGIGYGGLVDAAGNSLDETGVTGEGGLTGETAKSFQLNLTIQPEPVYITSVSGNTNNAQGNTLLPRSYYEINPRAGDNVSAPPTTYYIDVSNPLPDGDYSDDIKLVRSGNSGGAADGDFGTLGQAGLTTTGTGFTVIPNTTVTLGNGPNGSNTRLTLTLPAGTSLVADYYRLYMPNTGDTAIQDVYGNQLDGEFLGDPATVSPNSVGNPPYEDLLPNGQYRAGMSGDGVAGGAFLTGFVVVPSGNLIYARPDYIEDPLNPSTASDGSISKPYSVLAPQATQNSLNSGTYDNGDPNGGLNSAANFLSGFNSQYDRAGIGRFARSAFYAASQLAKVGPVVIVALPGTPQRDPVTGVTSQKTFVLQAPSGADPVINDGSGSVPADTTLVFNSGSSLKLQNASLFAQNQGSAIQALGGPNPNDRVNFTSYADSTVGGVSNGDPSTTPRGGDWGGIVLRNYDETINGRSTLFPVDGILKNASGGKALSGADDVMSDINFATIKYAGGAVPATRGTRYDAITLYNSRPAITNSSISFTNSAAGSQAAISGDLDSFREDDTARGPLIRRITLSQNSLNGIWVRPELSGYVQQSDAKTYTDNPLSLGGSINYVFDDNLPYILTSRLEVGTELLLDTANQTNAATRARLYIAPGMMVKSQRGAGIEVKSDGSSLIVGDRTYITKFDAEATLDTTTGLVSSVYGPELPSGAANTNFSADTVGDAKVLFTSLYDNTATTSYFDPIAQTTTIIVAALDSANTGAVNPLQPTPGNVPALARWGSISYYPGAYGIIDEAEIRYGGGNLNVAGGTIVRQALSLLDPAGGFSFTGTSQTPGSRVMITNNNFYDNADAAMYIDPSGLLAADPLTPLSSGHPYFRGNVLQRNGLDGLAVGQIGGLPTNTYNLSNNSSWDQTDITYILRGTIIPSGSFTFGTPVGGVGSTPPPLAQTKPSITLTIQSALPGTLLADGTSIARPGESVLVKMLGTGPGDAVNGSSNADNGGAGFLFGVDDGIDPTADPLIDQGNNSQLRILGIGGNETTGQTRVPVIITSIYDDTVGKTVRGVDMSQVIEGNTTAPKAGDGGLIYFGGNSLTTYNAFDIREGNKIDNADIRYITRIEMQGGGNIDWIALTSATETTLSSTDDVDDQKAGVFPNLPDGSPDPRNAYIKRNAPKELTISNSNFTNFRDDGILAHAGFNLIAGGRTSFGGESNQLFLYNNTFANMPTAVRIVGQNHNNTDFPDPTEILALNNTFYNNALGIDIISPVFNGQNSRSHVHVILMDNIFSNSSNAAIQDVGQVQGSVLEYNLFWANAADFSVGSTLVGQNYQPVLGDPMFRDAPNGNYQLMEGSAAIDAGRSELSLVPTSNGATVTTLLNTVDQVLTAVGGTRNTNDREPDSFFFGFGNINTPNSILTLPGYPLRGYIDQWMPVLTTDSSGYYGPASTAASYKYASVDGERDLLGYLREKDPASSNVGFGSRPFFDIGAYEYRKLFAPTVTAVNATVTDSSGTASTIPFYSVNGTGTNQTLQTIQVTFNSQLDTSTITGATVLLEASGGDGLFGNANSAADKFYNLSGKLAFDPNTDILTINIGAAGLTLKNDKYRLILLGSGSTVIRDKQGNALDGENTVGGLADGGELPLPSGNGFPGGSFFDTFIVNNQPATIAPGTFALDPSTDSNLIDGITNINKPAFSGNISVISSALQPLAGQTVIIDVSTKGDGVFDRLNAGTALTDANGHFLVTVGTDGASTGLVTDTSPLPDSPYNVGPDGILAPGNDDKGYTLIRVRVIDQSGNASNQITDPLSAFVANGATAGAVIDTVAPRITSFSPTPGSSLTKNAQGGLTFSFTTNKNIDPASLNSSNLLVTRAGPDGIIGTSDDVSVTVNTASIAAVYLKNGVQGPEQITFSTSGSTPNDLYQVTIKGASTSPVIDIAGNRLAGLYGGSFPTGQTGGAGTDFVATYVLSVASNSTLRFVGAAAAYVTDPTAAVGSRDNPYPTIGAAITASSAGDTIAVLPGYYTEKVVLKPFIKLKSASADSTDTNLVNGSAQQTVIRAPAVSSTDTTSTFTVSAFNLPYVNGVDTEVAGFTIASPLLGDPALGTINPQSASVFIINSNILLDRNYLIDSHMGVRIDTTGSNALTPRILDNGIIGNDVGIVLYDNGTTTSTAGVTQLLNNTIAFNNIGLYAINTSTSPLQANLQNNIVWENHDTTPNRDGTGLYSSNINKLLVQNNLIQGNGPKDAFPYDDAVNIGNGFNAGALSSTPDGLGNFTGNPAFVAPRDPRPTSDGPGIFFNDANFDLTKNSAAIDAANNAAAPAYDFRLRTRVRIPGKGFPGTGPADVGAFEYNGSGGITTAGGAFRIATTSLAYGGGEFVGGATFSTQAAPTSIVVTFSGNVNPSSVKATDLVLSGSGLNPVNPAKATSFSWVDNHTVKFNITGGYNSAGTVKVSIPAGTVLSTTNKGNLAFNDSFKVSSTVAGTNLLSSNSVSDADTTTSSTTSTDSKSSTTTTNAVSTATPTTTTTNTPSTAAAITPTAPTHVGAGRRHFFARRRARR